MKSAEVRLGQIGSVGLGLGYLRLGEIKLGRVMWGR